MTNETTLWDKCLAVFKSVVTEKQMKMWVLPLSVKLENKTLNVFAPNKFIQDSVEKNYFPLIEETVAELSSNQIEKVFLSLSKPKVSAVVDEPQV